MGIDIMRKFGAIYYKLFCLIGYFFIVYDTIDDHVVLKNLPIRCSLNLYACWTNVDNMLQNKTLRNMVCGL